MGDVRIIAEFGSNLYPFDRGRMKGFLSAAKESGATGAKVQLFRADHFPITERPSKEGLEFPRNQFEWFCNQATSMDLDVGASVFDKEAVDLCREVQTSFIKIATREERNANLIRYAFVSHFKWITDFIQSHRWPFSDDLKIRGMEIPLACIPEYPAMPVQWWNLASIPNSLEKGKRWGWSSHTSGIEDVLFAVYYGATWIEKHFCMEYSDIEADWSLTPHNFKQMVNMIRRLER